MQEAYEGVKRADNCSRSPEAQEYWASGSSSEEDPDKIKAEIEETNELALETQKQYNEVKSAGGDS